jgi:hypothetical protein
MNYLGIRRLLTCDDLEGNKPNRISDTRVISVNLGLCGTLERLLSKYNFPGFDYVREGIIMRFPAPFAATEIMRAYSLVVPVGELKSKLRVCMLANQGLLLPPFDAGFQGESSRES